MTPIENPECPRCDAAQSVERIGDKWVCSCCDHSWPVGQKRERRRTDNAGVPYTEDSED